MFIYLTQRRQQLACRRIKWHKEKLVQQREEILTSLIALNINVLNSLLKRQGLTDKLENDPIVSFLSAICFRKETKGKTESSAIIWRNTNCHFIIIQDNWAEDQEIEVCTQKLTRPKRHQQHILPKNNNIKLLLPCRGNIPQQKAYVKFM